MLKRYFIPILVALLFTVVMVYFLGGHRSAPRDVRAAVPVEHFTLSNGLSVVVMPNDRIPVVTHLLVVKAGGGDDPQGKSGLAHYLEHLMFTGTPNFPEGAYDRAVAKVGGAQNAYTTRDYTLYYATVPAAHLAAVMTMEADRLAHLDFAADKAAREVKVVTEERGIRVENNPAAQWSEQLDAITFLNHPYGQPLIGWAEDIASFTAVDARGFFEKYYRPSNMILVVAGDVTARDVRRMAQRYYGGLPAGKKVVRHWAKEPPVRLKRSGEMRDERVNEPRLRLQFAAPSVKDGTTSQVMPLAVFAQYLGGGDASALYTALVREQHLATSVSADYDPHSIGPALFRISAIPAAGVSLDDLEKAIQRELTRILAAPLDAAAVARAKTLLAAEVTFAQDGLESLANIMASLYAVGLDEQYFYGWSDAIVQVTDAQALEAARAVLVPSRAVVGRLLPPEPAALPVAAPATSPAATPVAPATPAPVMEVPYGP
jgi:zinc protease